jgi:5'-methylthioadenosine phosphorylase
VNEGSGSLSDPNPTSTRTSWRRRPAETTPTPTTIRAMRIGIITGSGTYALPGFDDGRPAQVKTRFGTVPVTCGVFAGADVVHVSRHREGHHLVSHQVTHQANISALAEEGVDAVLSATVCGACDPDLELGSLVVFDDLHFLANRLPDGSICTLHTEPGAPGRGHWIFDSPFSNTLRQGLLQGAASIDHPVRDGGCYGHVDGPRFNTRTEIRSLMQAGVTCVSQTAGPETVLAGEAQLPYALLGYATDYANGVKPEAPTPVSELIRLVQASTDVFARALAAAIPLVDAGALTRNGTAFSWD